MLSCIDVSITYPTNCKGIHDEEKKCMISTFKVRENNELIN